MIYCWNYSKIPHPARLAMAAGRKYSGPLETWHGDVAAIAARIFNSGKRRQNDGRLHLGINPRRYAGRHRMGSR